ncbi:hypothetical protein [Bacillus sp. JCM 19034]|nr:hypothetical protein [Bacillus sp. JCM 19034]
MKQKTQDRIDIIREQLCDANDHKQRRLLTELILEMERKRINENRNK